jgi:glucose/arabinose dehydrogenase
MILPGRNYGWPEVSHGMNYNGTPITDETERLGMEPSKHYWTPSIAICGSEFYTGYAFPNWRNNLFVSGMATEELHRLVIEDQTVVKTEVVLNGQGRVRDVATGKDGFLYVLLKPGARRVGSGSVYRLVPVDES